MPRTRQFDEEEVLQKAIELFWKQGFYATSMDNLVKSLGINRGSLYSIFGSKKGLFTTALQTYRAQNKRQLKAFLAEQPSIKEGFKNMFLLAIEQSFEDEDNKGCFVINCTTELVPNDDDIISIVIGNRKEFEKFFVEYLQEGVETGEISKEKNLNAIASFLYTLYSGLKVVAKTRPSKEELTDAILVGLSILD